VPGNTVAPVIVRIVDRADRRFVRNDWIQIQSHAPTTAAFVRETIAFLHSLEGEPSPSHRLGDGPIPLPHCGRGIGHCATTVSVSSAKRRARSGFVQSVGTAASLLGTGEALRRHDDRIEIVAVEPAESPVLSGGKTGAHKIEGIGAGFVVPLWRADGADAIPG
jgi:hypothetical protein